MAGIGFVLRKLSKRDNLLSTIQAFAHATIASSGPWIFTVIALGMIVAISDVFTSSINIYFFQLVIIYNFAFSMVISGPIIMICTRFLADQIYSRDLKNIVGLFFGAIALLTFIQLPLLIWFYFYYISFNQITAIMATINYLLITYIWLLSAFLTAMKSYKMISFSFLIGLTFAICGTVLFAQIYQTAGMLAGFNIGIMVIIAILCSCFFVEFPYKIKNIWKFLKYFYKYWDLALAGLIYNMAAWVDKWIMWFSPQALKFKAQENTNFFLYPNYDSAMFLAYLSIIPSLAVFIYKVETGFFEKQRKFFSDLNAKANLDIIYNNQKSIIDSFVSSSAILFALQAAIAISLILVAPQLFKLLGVNYLQIGMFRYGVLGVSFQIFFLFFTIILAYFDNRISILKCYFILLVTNAAFTYASMQLGFDYYGLGYTIACIISFVYAAFQVVKNINELPYYSFIKNNTAIN